MRFFVTIGAALVRVPGTGWAVAVFHPIARFLRCAGAKVYCDHGRPAHFATQMEIFISADMICLGTLPGKFADPGSRLARSHAVLPVIARGEVAPRVAHGGHIEAPQGIQHV